MHLIENLQKNIQEIEIKLGYAFTQKQLLVLAFIHRSFYNENRHLAPGHNERLEFLGDSVLGLTVSGYLYNHLPEESEGHLSHLRSQLVGAESCARYMRILDLEDYLMLGKGELINVGRGRDRILADLFEAIIGAIYLDGGLKGAQDFFFSRFAETLAFAIEAPSRNFKAELQDFSQKRYQKPPDYVVLQEEGPPHNKMFVVAVFIEGAEMGRGQGPSKKQAEQDAAEDALLRIAKGEYHGKS